MRNFLCKTLVCLLLPTALFAQKPYFQQTVNTIIKVSLNDQTHVLSGTIEMEYINNSPDRLSEIWMHCWGNAYKNRKTALSKQFLKAGEGKMYFASEEKLGGFSGLDFLVNGVKTQWYWDPSNPDIALIKLAKPLEPGGKININTPFTLKIPHTFSRLGHVGESYQMTQWFPKPAVYDNQGWHPMPYLNMGEFYSEFGSYDVSITLPENYVVGATGALQTPSEILFLRKKEAESSEKLAKGVDIKDVSFPASSTTMKTIRYYAENVHDFGWFADKRFLVQKDTAHLENGKTVDCWAMFTNEGAKVWKKGAFFVRRSVEYYSSRVGAYPYPHATAVLSSLSAGGGMEYPMITVINNERTEKSLDEVITHEVGHNWFYGILASNERDHPFMDEGMNSYFEQCYMQTYYKSDVTEEMAPKWLIDKEKTGSIIEIGYLLHARQHIDIPPDTHSDKFTQVQYGLMVYTKTAFCLTWLEQSVGRAKFDRAWQDYFRKWQYKHPQPEDFKVVMADNGIDVTWFMQTMQTQKQVDYALENIARSGDGYLLTIKNKGEINAPFSIAALKNGQKVEEKWFDPIAGTGSVSFATTEADAFEIDNAHVMLDVNRKNNYRKASGAFAGYRPIKATLFAPIEKKRHSILGVLPWLGWNNYDKTQLGLLFYNAPLPAQKFQYYVAPGYGFGSENLTGIADLRYKIYPHNGIFQRITVGVSGKKFSNSPETNTAENLGYFRIVPSLKFDLRSNSRTFKHHINLRTLFIGNEYKVDSVQINTDHSTIYEARYQAEQVALPNPYRLSATVEIQNYQDGLGRSGNYVRTGLEWKQQFYYQNKRKISARLYGGLFLHNSNKNRNALGFGQPNALTRGSLSLSQTGYTDYKYDHVYFGRNDASGFRSRQVQESEGGFKYGFGSAQSNNVGHSNAYLFAVNLKADLPKKLPLGLPIKPWFDIGYAKNLHAPIELTTKDQLFWSGGLMLGFLNDNLCVYFPLASSKNLRQLYIQESGGSNNNAIFGGGNYGKWISWTMNLNNVEPIDVTNRMLR